VLLPTGVEGFAGNEYFKLVRGVFVIGKRRTPGDQYQRSDGD
jgi:hypothetical protein